MTVVAVSAVCRRAREESEAFQGKLPWTFHLRGDETYELGGGQGTAGDKFESASCSGLRTFISHKNPAASDAAFKPRIRRANGKSEGGGHDLQYAQPDGQLFVGTNPGHDGRLSLPLRGVLGGPLPAGKGFVLPLWQSED